MFIPKSFEITDETTIHQLIEENSFGTLVSNGSAGLIATHLPLVLSKDKTSLIGHLARANDQWKDLANENVLAIFQGPHHYISPDWYETKDAVPTWNYLSVHISGKFQIMDDEQILIQSLGQLVKKYESEKSKYKLEQVYDNLLINLRKGIVGFEIKIEKFEAKAKLSQNHSIERQKMVINELEKLNTENANSIADWMKNNL
ncbi:MAG: FMN-binding negative transcriptional regulator [Leptospira sp.]|nr:FMN-binding negative transcriptional regulator [Leptospira sp.]